jgi:hypothetical protein
MFKCSECGHVQTIKQDPSVHHHEETSRNTRTVFVQCLNEGGKVHEFETAIDETRPHNGVSLQSQVRCTCSMALPVETHKRQVREKVVDDQGRESFVTKIVEVDRVPMVPGQHTYLALLTSGQELSPAGQPIRSY